MVNMVTANSTVVKVWYFLWPSTSPQSRNTD